MKSSYYSNVAKSLERSADFISNQISSITSDISFLQNRFSSTELYGDAYELYWNKANVVIKHLKEQRDELYQSISKIRKCASKAREKSKYWLELENVEDE